MNDECKFCLYRKFSFEVAAIVECKVCSLTGNECVEKCKDFEPRTQQSGSSSSLEYEDC